MVELYALRPKGTHTPEGSAWIIQEGKTTVCLTFEEIRKRYGEIPVLDLEAGKYLEWEGITGFGR